MIQSKVPRCNRSCPELPQRPFFASIDSTRGFVWSYITLLCCDCPKFSNPRPSQRLGQAFPPGFKEHLHRWSDEVPRMRHFITTASPHPQCTTVKQLSTAKRSSLVLPFPPPTASRGTAQIVAFRPLFSLSEHAPVLLEFNQDVIPRGGGLWSRRLSTVFATSGGVHNDEMGLSDSLSGSAADSSTKFQPAGLNSEESCFSHEAFYWP
jgi:hypothetical protein